MIYDILQPLFECEVYPGDTCDLTAQDAVSIIEKAALYDVSGNPRRLA